jgi:hypothetical protein
MQERRTVRRVWWAKDGGMTAMAWRRTVRAVGPGVALLGALLASPAAALATDDGGASTVAASVVTGVGGSVDLTDPVAGPLLLLLVAGTLGLLGALSGPEATPAPDRSVHRQREHIR